MKVICLTCNKAEKFFWQISPNISKNQSLSSSRLVLQPNSLIVGENYKFNVSVQNDKGFATSQLFTPKVINESCTALPLEGTEFFTEFTITCSPNPAIPLIYVLLQGRTQLFSSNNPVFTSKLNADNDVRVRIQDSYGQYQLVEIKVNIKKTTALNSIEEINDIFTSKNSSLDLKRMIADESQSNALVFINMVASRLKNLKPVGVSDIASQILDLINELKIVNFDVINPITHTLKNLLSIDMNHKIALKCAKILDKISSALQNSNDDISASDYVSTTNSTLSVLNQLINPFEAIPPVQNVDSLVSHEYHEENYEYYGELDFAIFEKLDNLETVTLSVEKTVNGLATCAAKLLQPMEDLGDMAANDIEVKVLAFDQEVARADGNRLEINGTTAVVTVSDQLLSQFDNESSISCTFFNKNPMWWFSDGAGINSDVVGVSMYRIGKGTEENVSAKLFYVWSFLPHL